MPLKGTLNTKAVQAYAEKELKSYLEDIATYIGNVSEGKIRDEIEKKTKTGIRQYQEFWTDFENTTQGSSVTRNSLQRLLNAIEAAQRTPNSNRQFSTRQIRFLYNKLIDESKKKIQSHEDFTVISSQLYLIYTELQKIQSSGVLTGIENISEVKLTQDEVAKLTERFRRLWISSKAIASYPPNDPSNPSDLDFTRRALEDYFKSTDQQQHLANKVTQVDVLTGKAEQKILFEIDTGSRDAAEYLLGGARNRALRKEAQQEGLKKIFRDLDDKFLNLKGSDSIDTQLRKQLSDLFLEPATGKKPKKYKSSSKYRNTTKGKKDQKILNEVRKTLNLRSKAGRKAKKLKAPVVSSTTSTQERDALSLAALRTKINRRLPAEVRRNMGRPALINRTGRFSNSVQLLDLKEGPNTLIGVYTYLQNPYRTFENQGERKWPVGYNPKPLITKSIRNLAQEHVDKRFTLRRV